MVLQPTNVMLPLRRYASIFFFNSRSEERKLLLGLCELLMQYGEFGNLLHVVKMIDVSMNFELLGAFKTTGESLNLLYQFAQLRYLIHKGVAGNWIKGPDAIT
jgi:hypothetical protein